jgi:hypothetical protein
MEAVGWPSQSSWRTRSAEEAAGSVELQNSGQ